MYTKEQQLKDAENKAWRKAKKNTKFKRDKKIEKFKRYLDKD